METKKNPKADLEKSRSIFFQIGLVVALAAVLLAFKISTAKKDMIVFNNSYVDFFEQEEVISTTQEKDKIIPPMPKELIPEVLIITDEPTETEFTPFSSETNGEEEIIVQNIALKAEEVETYIDPVFFAEKMPVFPGGEIGLRKFLATKVKYPKKAIETELEGKVYVRFCVMASGSVGKVSIARGVDPILDNEAIRVVKSLPNWKAGESGGRKVSVWHTVPIVFKINK